MRGYLGSFLAVAAVVTLVVLIWRAIVAPPPERLGINTASAATAPGLQVTDTTAIGWGRGPQRGKKLWKLTARRIQVSADQRTTSFIGVTDAVFFRDGRPHAHLKAGSAVYQRDVNTIQVAGAVELRLTGQDVRLTTERLSWQAQTRTVTIPGPVTLQSPDYRIQARQGQVDLQRTAVRVEGVTGQYHGVSLAADTTEYDAKARTLKLVPVRLQAEGWSLDASRAQVKPRTGELRAEKVSMNSRTESLFPFSRQDRRSGVRLASAGLIAGLLTGAASAAPSEQPAKAKESPPKEVYWLAGLVEARKTSDGRDIFILSEGVTFTHPDPKDPKKKMVLTADRVQVDEQKDGSSTATATGSPKATDDRSEVTGEKIILFLKSRRAVVEGGVKIVTRPKSSTAASAQPTPAASTDAAAPQAPADRPKSARDRIKGEVVITGKRAEYNYRQKNALVDGNVVVTNRGRKLTTPKAAYVDKAEEWTLTGPVDGTDEKGQTFHHEGDMRVVVKEGAESFESIAKTRVHGQLFIKEDEDEPEAETPAKTTASAPAEAKPAGPGTPGASNPR